MKVKICPECKTKFSCEENESCWCYSLPHVKFNTIVDEKEDCICPKCLKVIINEKRDTNFGKI